MPRKFQDGGKLSFLNAPVVTVNFMYVIFKPCYMDSIINNLNQTSLTQLYSTHIAHTYTSYTISFSLHSVNIAVFMYVLLYKNIKKF